MDKKQGKRFQDDTLAVLAGEDFHPLSASQPPIFQTTNFRFDSVDEMVDYAEGRSSQYLYTRNANPTIEVAEKKLAALERGEAGLVTSSGMAALACALFGSVKSGDRILAARSLYGGTLHLLNDIVSRFGIAVDWFDIGDPDSLRRQVQPATRLLLAESPTNPALRLLPLKDTADFARERGITSILDNTFASPWNQKPLELGWDVVVHSATKYLGGHSDVTAGVIVARRELIDRIAQFRRWFGAVLDPSAAYLLIRGAKTLALRVQKQNDNALRIARFLEGHPQVEAVNYPFLESHPQYELARRQMRGGGGVLSFSVRGGWPPTRTFFNSLRMIPISTSLGGVESLVTSPFWTSHYGMSEAELRDSGVTQNLVRLSVGIESVDELCDDLDQALRLSASSEVSSPSGSARK
ncbi:MAG TPA: aminotransferase class I/II-fold pyridoxal phosphate-dependent enzyme [Acidobacteriota bacterium]|nr:aminotransferase class I/II-fold pyridoxal phosphate-dependent enzyme [Acidobacteriota bacterium]